MLDGIRAALIWYVLCSWFYSYKITASGACNVILDAFLVCSAIAFVRAGVSYIQYLSRSKPVTTAELAGKDIVGTEHSQLKPTQDYVYKEKVTEYVNRISNGEKIEPINVAKTHKGMYILDGHHRYVASQLTNTQIKIIIEQGGPIGFPDWTYVKWI